MHHRPFLPLARGATASLRTIAPALLVGTLLGACGDDTRSCTAELRFFAVEVRSPDGLPIDKVTVENKSEQECETFDGEVEAAAIQEYSCHEQGDGEYLVRVYSGERTFEKRTTLPFDGCHIEPPDEPLVIEIE